MLRNDGGQRAEFTARYFVESPDPLQKVAETIAGEQSSGTFLELPGETAELKQRARARVTRIEPQAPALEPGLHSALVERRGHHGVFHRGEIEIAFPVDNVGANLPTLLATVAGNLYELGELTGVRLLDLDLPEAYAKRFPGPRFAVAGTRAKAGVHGRPLIGTIIKPSIGLSAEQTAALVDTLLAGGIDFLKDDELTADPVHAPFDQRLSAVMPVLHRHADRLGRMPMYAINISGTVDEMLRRHDDVLRAGGTCVMASINWVGFAGLQHLREHCELPIHGHRNGWGALSRHPGLGMSFPAYQKLWRLAGVDQLHVGGLRSKFSEPDAAVVEAARACLAPFAGSAPVMPVFSSGQWAGHAPALYAALGSIDLMHLAGGGIVSHPAGVAAGVASMREAWEAATAGLPLADYAAQRPALRAALEKFGSMV
ncbi:ribulose-bisphosphate carboxylase large subunit family protein [Arenimonas sp.]|uniref:ribulose-bisphosphate carboxylase large subunit family protein n=1 Tax=Arenimonas sp. TaxID=1872635 RepID=UPI002E33D6F5|nr:ribulose-bisphosphate carboxylase large subunit family protein [Arenimonas sp.]HEX4853703.1 ribulose-bisphosphate carboxylase large subunit family protein [Arenimonas sp.]